MNKQHLISFIISIWTLCTIVGCSDGVSTTNQSSNLVIGTVMEIPVLDGQTVTTGVYIQNPTNQVIDDIQYTITNKSKPIVITDDTACKSIAANSSCLLPIRTPSLALGDSGSSLLIASEANRQSKQLLNYHYIKSSDYNGVRFSRSRLVLPTGNSSATVYVFASNDGVVNDVSFASSHDSVSIVNGLTDGTLNLAHNQVVALEVKANQAQDSVLIHSNVSTNEVTASNNINNSLQIVIAPTNEPNLIMGNVPVLSKDESEAVISIFNNGNTPALGVILTSDDENNILVEPGNTPCDNLDIGDSCNYKVTLKNTTNNGSAILTLSYSGLDSTSYSANQTVYYHNMATAPMVYITPNQNSIIVDINTITYAVFNVHNIGGEALSGISPRVLNTLSQTTATIGAASTCSNMIAANSSCEIIVDISSNATLESGIMYINLLGTDSTGHNYSFMSLPMNVEVYADTPFLLSSVNPPNNGIVPSSQNFISMVFESPVNISTVNANTVSVVESGTLDNILGSCSLITPNEVNCSLTSPLSDNKYYTLTVTTDVKSSTGINLNATWVSNFQSIYISPQYRLATAASYSCMLNADTGKAYCWGYNVDGELGNGTTDNANTPVAVAQGEIPAGEAIISINAGTSFTGKGTTCAITTRAKAYCWGDNRYGAVGDDTIENRLTPVAVATRPTVESSALEESAQIIQISASSSLTCALDHNGQAYCWGKVNINNAENLYGYLGDAAGTQVSNVPIKVDQSISGPFTQISSGGVYACGLTESGDAYCWGSNRYGTLGNGQSGTGATVNKKTPTLITSMKFSSISASKDNPATSATIPSAYSQHTCGIGLNDGQAYCWGGNINGALGIGLYSSTVVSSPALVYTKTQNTSSDLPGDVTIKSISAGSQSTCAIDSNNVGYCWGFNNYGQLGIGSTTRTNLARLVMVGESSQIPVGVGFQSLYTGLDNGGSLPAITCGLATNSQFYCWGDNTYGQVGIGITGGNYTTPQNVAIPN